MGLFQQSVIKKYISGLEENKLKKGWIHFESYFKDNIQQEKVINSKEEQFQYPFLDNLFDKCLGYTIDGNEQNLFTEFKNVTDSKKADGAIKINDEVVTVIELKSTKIKDFNKIQEQAFGYKVSHPNCKYVVTSNFNRLRFYIENTTAFEEFDLFNLTYERFKLLWLCLSFESVSSGIPLKIKSESTLNEENITRKLYKDYSLFRKEIFNDIIEKNQQYDKLTLFNKTQKLLDRFLFIFFAEDRRLLPVNSISKIIEKWEDDIAYGDEKSLYTAFTLYFNLLNKGRPASAKREEIFAYNGGLFAPDEILNNISINDKLLSKHTKNLSTFDFESDVSVNILGQIFEHSLSEIEEIQNEIAGVKTNNTSKRKKDGVFYTPNYITKYIVDYTIGKLCQEKKEELEINEEVYTQRKARSKKRIDNLDEYRNWLLGITICDPACGSGAFLVQALDFLIEEHKYIDELNAAYHGASIPFSDITSSILENNLYGVDINGESVEIAKLSLWLRTAQKGRKLTSLNSNIKCGNSLIDDPEVAGNGAFKWENEFPEVFNNGGFDVIIGNPPYVLCQPSNTNEIVLNYFKKFDVASYKIDLFHLFFEKSIKYLVPNGKLGFITPNTYLNNKYIKPLRSFILKKTNINIIINYKDQIFADAGVDVATIILTKEKIANNKITIIEVENSLEKYLGIKPQILWTEDKDKIFNLNEEFPIKFNNCLPLNEICNSYFGIQAYDRKSTISINKLDDKHLPIIDGGDIDSFSYSLPTKYFNFLPEKIKSGGNYNVYNETRIVVSQIGYTPIVGICEKGVLGSNTLYNINLKPDSKFNIYYILSVLNSRLIKAYWISKYYDGKKLFPKIKGYQLKELPIKIVDEEFQIHLIDKAEKLLSFNSRFQQLRNALIQLVLSKLKIENISKKLQNWNKLDFKIFIEELKKNKKHLSLSEEAEWIQYFNEQKIKTDNLKIDIEKTKKEIDHMVYELYGLTQEEIEFVENATK